jgi:hypothetical protein
VLIVAAAPRVALMERSVIRGGYAALCEAARLWFSRAS